MKGHQLKYLYLFIIFVSISILIIINTFGNKDKKIYKIVEKYNQISDEFKKLTGILPVSSGACQYAFGEDTDYTNVVTKLQNVISELNTINDNVNSNIRIYTPDAVQLLRNTVYDSKLYYDNIYKTYPWCRSMCSSPSSTFKTYYDIDNGMMKNKSFCECSKGYTRPELINKQIQCVPTKHTTDANNEMTRYNTARTNLTNTIKYPQLTDSKTCIALHSIKPLWVC